MDMLALLVDLHKHNKRQGPGGDDETRLAIRLSGLQSAQNLRIADIGCGTCAQTRVLAQELDARVVAVDFLAEFLEMLDDGMQGEAVPGSIEKLVASMDDMPFEPEDFDAIWSEGAIYNIGFEAGIRAWRRYLKPRGVLAVSELTWFTAERPAAIEAHWTKEYPEIATAGTKIALLEKHGYTPIGYFPLPEGCWRENYYRPLEQGFDAFLARHGSSAEARAVVASHRTEIALYNEYAAYFGYGYYLARKAGE
jgi:SAM-dependent methyltransferase